MATMLDDDPLKLKKVAGPMSATGTAAPAPTPDPFAAMGGGEFFSDTGQWIPKNNEAALTTARARTGQAAPAAPASTPPVATPTAPAAPTDPGAPAAAPVAPASADPAAPPATVNDAFKKALLDRLNKPIGVDQNDPVLKGQMDAFSNAQTRAKQRDREALAGRAAATGQLSDLSSGGAFDEGLSNLEQRQGEAEAGFGANLAGDELNKQRDELYRYAALAGNQLSGEEGRALQERISNLNAQIQREQMTQQGGQFDKDLALRKMLGEMGIDTQKLGITTQGGLGQGDLALRDKLGSAGLNMNLLQLLMGNEQFGQAEAGTNARFGAGLDADMWRALMGGLG